MESEDSLFGHKSSLRDRPATHRPADFDRPGLSPRH